MKKIMYVIWLMTIVFLFSGCKNNTPPPTENNSIGMDNPAIMYCIQQWWSIAIYEEKNKDIMMCTLPDLTSCEIEAFFRGECTTSSTSTHNESPIWDSSEEEIAFCTDHYLPVCALVTLDDGQQVEQTFGNECYMPRDAFFLYDGECTID